MKLIPSSTARRRTASADLRSLGGPQMPSPVRRIAPKPRRCTEISSLSKISPAAFAESSFLFIISLQNFPFDTVPRCLSVSPCLFENRGASSQALWVGVGAIELMTRFIKLKLAGFRSLRGFCEKRGNLRRIHRLKTSSSLESLLKNRKRIAASDDHTGWKTHGVVKALHRSGCLTLENKVVTHGLHAKNADSVLEQDGQNLLFETVEVRVHYVQRHLNGIEREAVLCSGV